MPIPNAVRDLMETVETHAQRMGSGPYTQLCSKMVALVDSLSNEAEATKREFATNLLVEQPSSAGALSVLKYTDDRKFMQGLMRRKAITLRAHKDRHCAAMMGFSWKIEMAEALMPYTCPQDLWALRTGVKNLFLARSNFLPQVVNRLNRLGISPHMLCPLDLGDDLQKGDNGCGPTAEDFLYYEPRFLRYLLGRGELEPWPTLGTPEVGGQTEYVRKLILVANSEGGDNERVNQACPCPRCRGVRIPTLDSFRPSLTPSECSSDSEG